MADFYTGILCTDSGLVLQIGKCAGRYVFQVVR